MNGAGSGDDKEPFVLSKEDLPDLTAAFGDDNCLRIGGSDLSAKSARRGQGDVRGNVEIGDFFHGQGVPSKRQKLPRCKPGGVGWEFSGKEVGLRSEIAAEKDHQPP